MYEHHLDAIDQSVRGVRRDLSSVGSNVSFISLCAIVIAYTALYTPTDSLTNRDACETEAAMHGIVPSTVVRMCMSGRGFDFRSEKPVCAYPYAYADAECYEPRGMYRSSKLWIAEHWKIVVDFFRHGNSAS